MLHGSRLTVHPDFEKLFHLEGIRTFDEVVQRWVPDPPASDRLSVVAEAHLAGRHFFVKRYRYAGGARFRTMFIPSRVRREYRNLLGLAKLGLRVPRPVAWGARRSLGFLTDSVLVTEAVAGAVDLRDLSAGTAKPAFTLPGPRERRELITSFARSLRRCHDAGWFLHTAFFKNLLLTRGAAGYVVWVIDVPFAHIWRNRLFPTAGRVRDFACLAKGAVKLLTRAERMRFARAYGDADKGFLNAVEEYRRRNYPDDKA